MKITKREKTPSGTLKYTVEYTMFTYTNGLVKQTMTFYACNKIEMKTKVNQFKNSICVFERQVSREKRQVSFN